jgi:redox-sensitive bicupin YhaK (pirin superfamily)
VKWTHKDSAGGGGTIKAGDVQWMTAGGGICTKNFIRLSLLMMVVC